MRDNDSVTATESVAAVHPLVQALAVADRLPREAIAAAVAHVAALTPDLLAIVERAADGTLPGDEATENQFFFALHILAAARETRLQAPLLRLLRRPHDDLDRLLRGGLTESLGLLVAGAFDGRAEDLFGLAGDPAIDELTRESVFQAIAFLTWDGRIAAAQTRAFLERLDEARALPTDQVSWFAWSRVVEVLGWEDMAPRVLQAYADQRIPPSMSDRDGFYRGLAETAAAPDDRSRFDQFQDGYLTDAIAELEKYNFEPAPEYVPLPPRRAPAWPESSNDTPAVTRWDGMPQRNPMRQVGRNDPCPCGSGKKYKKCCMAA